MKKILFVCVIAAACYACGGGYSESATPVSNNEANSNSQIGGAADAAKPGTPAPAADSAAATAAPAAAAGGDGKALIAKSDCLTCHKENEKVIGPSYKEVAQKYPNTEANVKMLAGKVIAGGVGVWGQIPMTAHPQLSKDDAEAMVRYILSLK